MHEAVNRSFLREKGIPLGLGCSRLGSVNGASGREASALLKGALDLGIRFFDTSNIYGQGDSERLLGDVLGRRDDCAICSKAGRYFPWNRRALIPIKGALRIVARWSRITQRGVAAARAKPLPDCWDAKFLLTSIDASLRRLRRDQIEVFMLHSPPVKVVTRGDAVGALEAAKKAGKIDTIGVSVDDISSAEAALDDTRIRVLQLPLTPGQTGFARVLDRSAATGVAVIAREIFGGSGVISAKTDQAAFVNARIGALILDPKITLALVGTTRIANLTVAVGAARAAMRSASRL